MEHISPFVIKIFGLVSIVAGAWGTIRPHSVKKRLQKRFNGLLRFLLVFLSLGVGGAVFQWGRETFEGWKGWVVSGGGVLAMLKGLFFLKGQAADRVTDWWGNRPDWAYRIGGLGLMGVGAAAEWYTRHQALWPWK